MNSDLGPDGMDGQGSSPIQAIVNAVDTIDYIAKSNQGVGVRELARALRLTRGTASRVLYSLYCCGLLRRDENQSRYVLGPKILELASGHLRSLSIGEVAHRHMAELSLDSDETVFLGILDRDHVTIVDRIDSTQPLRMASELGVREPAYCTALGKILMADLSNEACRRLLEGQQLEPHTAKTLRSIDAVLACIDEARERGWALDDEEFFEGVRCIAAAIRDHDGRVVAAVSVGGPRFRLHDDKLQAMAQRVRAAAAAISRDLGYAPKLMGERRAPA